MKRTITILTLCAMLFALCVSAQAQQPTGKIPRIGYVSSGNPDNTGPQTRAFREGLRDLGYVEGKNILVEYRHQLGKPERGPTLVAELLQLKVDILVVVTSPAIRAAKQATKTIPVVIVTTADPVGTGLVESLARPGGNITGITRLTRDLNGKRLELFTEVVSTRSPVGVLFQAESTSGRVHFNEYETAAHAIKVRVLPMELRGPKFDFGELFSLQSIGTWARS